MENKKNNSVMVDALSPSRITDYFNSSRTKTKGCHVSAKQQHQVSAASIYLTPESSPGSDLTSDAPRDGDETSSTTNVLSDQDLGYNTDTPTAGNTTVLASNESVSNVPDSTSINHLTNIRTSSCKSHEELNRCSESQQVNSGNSQAHIQVTENLQMLLQTTENSKPSKSRHGKGRNANIVPEAESLVTSPSVPRPKLRKSAKSNSESDGLVPASIEPAKPKPGRRKKKEPEPIQKNVITDFFPVRRSGRVTKSEIQKEKQHQLEEMILSKCEDGLQITDFENKGRGVVTTKDFEKGDFIVEYAGELIDTATAKQREKDYTATPEIGCYMYFFSIGPKHYCVDATAESGRLGRLINHSREGNCCTKSVIVNSRPRLILVANRNIRCGEELSYDYGDRSRAAIEAHPWLKL